MDAVKHVLAWGALILAVLVASSAHAEEESPSAVDQARAHFVRGVELYQAGEYEASLADFVRAYELAPHWRIFYNIGRVRAQLGQYTEAIEALERYLREGGRQVPRSRQRQVERELRRIRGLVGLLIVEIEGPPSATIYVDNTVVGNTPLEAPITVSAGAHTLELRAPGFHPSRREIVVAGGTTETVSETLAVDQQAGSVAVTTSVPGADIYVDGIQVGTTPLTEPLPAPLGRHVIEARRRGYETIDQPIVIVEGQDGAVHLDLRPMSDLAPSLSGRLEVEASEDDVSIFVDGQRFDRQPLPIGPHVVEVRRRGFRRFSETVSVDAGGTTRLQATLVPTRAYRLEHQIRGRAYRLLSLLTASLGAAVLGTTIGLYLWNLDRHDEWLDQHATMTEQATMPPEDRGQTYSTPTSADSEYAASQSLGDELQYWSVGLWIGLGTSVVVLAAAAYLFFAGPDPNRYQQVDLSIAAGGQGTRLDVGWAW